MSKVVRFVTLGCKVNQYETNAMAQKFLEKGYQIIEEITPENEDIKPDICIINTCTVTNMSDRKSRQMLRRMKEKNPSTIVVAVGCYAQVAKKELAKIPEIDLVLGNNEKVEIVKHVEEYINNHINNVELDDVMYSKEFSDFGDVTYTEKTRAVIKIQDGCDRFCSYCIIPYARGRVRSRKPENIISEITQIASKGIKEVVITGIHIASYGKDFAMSKDSKLTNYRLIDLLEEINEIQGIQRIRLGSIEPLLITVEFVERLKKLEKICHHFHLSLQSGCDETLKRMNRRYTTEQFKEIVRLLRNAYSDVNLTTDIIVGFPGETDEEFNKTYQFLKEIKFYKMHVFKYSPRKGTKAAVMPNQINGDIKEERSKKLIELSDRNEIEYNKSYIGKNVEVLFEEEKDGMYKGHTQNYIMVYCQSKEKLDNKIIDVVCEKAEKEHIIAIME
ncbi:miaB family protein possibly involved in tRNA or rRNA modification [Clostridium sp. CAG:470]|nr:MAG: tRNA (N(6)-L-threonylcarbamoyladenosine(37)-C(2))-methylthiotransferase MtaB [Clostridium sp. 28_17]CDE13976.1 miaB family protein possibly involved in tRNA or rRNA modification [Clostridium sp. CAG:470]